MNRLRFKKSNVDSWVDAYWPVGSIYMSINSVNPSTYFGGTWEVLPQDYYLITAPITQTNIGKGGSWYTNDTVLTVDQIPSHNHYMWYNTTGGGYASSDVMSARDTATTTKGSSGAGNWYVWTQSSGGSNGHNHKYQPPYYQVYAWKRVS